MSYLSGSGLNWTALGLVEMPTQLSNDLLFSVLESVTDGLVVVNPSGAIEFANEAAEKILGTRLGVLVGAPALATDGRAKAANPPVPGIRPGQKSKHTGQLLTPGALYSFPGELGSDTGVFMSDARTPCLSDDLPVQRALRGQTVTRMDLWVEGSDHADGVYIEASARPLLNGDGSIARVLCVFRDVTPARQAEHRLALFRKVVSNTQEAILVTDAEDSIVFVNDAFVRVTGFERQDVIGKPLGILWHGQHGEDIMRIIHKTLASEGRWSGELRNRRKSGELYPILASISAVHDDDGGLSNHVAVFSDMTSARQAEEQLFRLTNQDPLTGLPNRKVFFEHLCEDVRRSSKNKRKFAIVLLDLRRFKEINDTLGHNAGDQVLLSVANMVRTHLKEGEFLARIGADEFVIIKEGITSDLDIAVLVETIEREFEQPATIEGQEVYISADIGIAVYPDDGDDAETLTKRANTALTTAKDKGGGYQFYTQRMNALVLKHFWVENSLRKALGTDQIVPYFQPQVDLATNDPHEAEVLIRWQHPELGFVSPADFIPAAERTGLIDPVTDQILSLSCQQLQLLKAARLPVKLIAVNFSARQFARPDLTKHIMEQVSQFNLDPGAILIEITESAFMSDPEEATRIVNDLKKAGFSLAIDDFGTGYSSLSYLHRFRVDQVKIDRSFVTGVASSTESRSIVRAIIAMCESLGLETLAEGVETQEQLDVLKELGCNKIQGYLISKPLSPTDYRAFLEKLPQSAS